MNFKEIEFKYRADNISLEDFIAYCQREKPEQIINASGYDHFYSPTSGIDTFCRHRVGADMNQLTFKAKLDRLNNVIRTEHNINLKSDVGVDQVRAFCEEFGYEYNTTLFKTCFVYKYPKHTLVYYIVYNTNMDELGRFLEIEAEETYPWWSDGEAKDHISGIEANLKAGFDVTPQHRVKKSLFELFGEEK